MEVGAVPPTVFPGFFFPLLAFDLAAPAAAAFAPDFGAMRAARGWSSSSSSSSSSSASLSEDIDIRRFFVGGGASLSSEDTGDRDSFMDECAVECN